MRYLAAIFLLILPSLSYAAPSISTASASGSLSITGSGFGTKSPAAPALWETFDSYTVGNALPVENPDWVKYSTAYNGGWVDNAHSISGSNSVFNRTQGASADTGYYGTPHNFNTSNWYLPSSSLVVYYSFNYYPSPTGSSNQTTTKLGRILTTGENYGGPNMNFQAWNVDGGEGPYSVWFRYDAEYDITPIDPYIKNYSASPTRNSWNRYEMYRSLSNPANTANGEVWFRNNGTLVFDRQNEVTRSNGETWEQTNIQLPLEMASPTATTDMSVWVDDVYVDITQARVELCTGSTWASPGSCNPQPPTSWSDGSISASLNTGPWTTGQQVYVFVVDSDGAANATGYGPITLTVTSNISPSVSITTPTSSATYSTSTAEITVGGTSNDPDGTVTSVTFTATGCTPSSGTATGTTTWSYTTTCSAGTNVHTATAHDDQSATGSDTLTATYTPPGSITCYLDADGDGYGVGTSETVSTCSANYYEAANLTATSGDCNDSDPLVYPGHGCGGQAIYSPTRFAPLTVSGWMSQ